MSTPIETVRPATVPALRRGKAARPVGQRRRINLRVVGAVIGAVFAVFPLYWMFITAITPVADLRAADYNVWPSAFQIENFSNAWNGAGLNFPRWYFNSFFIAIVSVILTVCINLLAGYTFAKLRFPGRNLLFVLIISTLVIPIQVLMVPQFDIVVALGWLDTNWGVIVPRLAEAFGIFLARQFFSTLPDELVEAARIDGANEFRIFFSVMLPLARPLIAVLVIFTFMWRWNEFAWPLIVLKDTESYTVPIGLLLMTGQYATDYSALMAMTLVSILPMVFLFTFFQRYFVEGMARSGIK